MTVGRAGAKKPIATGCGASTRAPAKAPARKPVATGCGASTGGAKGWTAKTTTRPSTKVSTRSADLLSRAGTGKTTKEKVSSGCAAPAPKKPAAPAVKPKVSTGCAAPAPKPAPKRTGC